MKKIATVSVLAIMAVSAARADIASTTYVDKAKAAVEGQVTELSGVVATKAAAADVTALAGRVTTAESGISTNATEIAKKAAQADVNTLTDKVGDVSLSGTNYMKTDTNLTAAVKSLDTQLSNVAGGNVDVNKIVDGSIAKAKLTQTLQDEISNATQGVSDNAGEITTIKNTMATDTELKAVSDNLANNYTNTTDMNQAIANATQDMAKTSDIGTGNLKVTIDGVDATGTFNANAKEDGTIAITVPSTYAKTADVASTYATKTALTEGLAGKVNNATLNNYYTKDAADAEFIDGDELAAATVANAGHATTADSATKATQDGAGKVITETYATKAEAAGYIDPAELTDELGSYYTKTQADTLLDAKLDDTAAGSATLPIYIDTNGVAQTITSYSGKAATAGAADTATTATNYNETSGSIKTKFDGVDTSLAKVAAFGNVPAVPATCAETNADGELTRDCTLVMKYNASTNAVTPEWEVIAR